MLKTLLHLHSLFPQTYRIPAGKKIVSAESMTRDEACVEMEFTDHDFYVFKDSERDDILCVIYRREAGGYGVLAVLETV